MTGDLTKILRDWKYNEKDNVRFLTTVDGREIMQIRTLLGIEQYELEGRPDGLRPGNHDTYLDVILEKIEAERMSESEPGLTDGEFQKLRDECMLYYYRYLALFQTKEYERTVRDTQHNLTICEIVREMYPKKEKDELLQYFPYILRVNAISRGMVELLKGNKSRSIEILEDALNTIETAPEIESNIFEFEKLRSLQHLKEVLESLREHPATKREEIEKALNEAIEKEDYEHAAKLRDQLHDL